MSQVTMLRKQSKTDFKRYLNELVYTNEFAAHWSMKLGLSKFKIVQIEKVHFVEGLDLLCYQFSCLGGTNHAKVFMLSIPDRIEKFSLMLKHAIDTGLGFVVLDKHNHIIAVFFGYDQCDKPDLSLVKSKYSLKLKHASQIGQSAHNNNLLYQKYILSRKQSMKYGDIFDWDIGAVRADHQNRNIAACCIPLMDVIIGLMGYKYAHFNCVHPKTIYLADRRFTNYGLQCDYKPFNFSNYTFNDGTNIQKYYDDLTNVYGFTDDYINDLKLKNSVFKVYVIDYAKMFTQKRYNKPIHLWQTAMIKNKNSKL